MKKFTLLLIAITVIAAGLLGLSGCGEKTEAREFGVTYHANGGQFSDAQDVYGEQAVERTVKVKRGDKLSAPDVSRNGFDLIGWSKEQYGPQKTWDFSRDVVTGDMHLYAQWQAQIGERILSVDGGSVTDDSVLIIVEPQISELSLDGKIHCSNDAVWELFTDYDGAQAVSKTISPADGDNFFYIKVARPDGAAARIYALNVHRSHEIAVIYDTDSESNHTEKWLSGVKYTVDHTAISPNGGYVASEWTLNGVKTTEFTPMYDSVLKPVYTARKFTVTLDPVGGELSQNTATATYDKPLTLPSPRKVGHYFVGWYDEDGNRVLADRDSITWYQTQDMTLYARYSPLSYKITVKSNDTNRGSVGGGGNFDYGAQATLTATINDGNMFLGWYDETNVRLSTEPIYMHTVDAETVLTAKFITCPVSATAQFGGVVDFPKTTVAGNQYTVKTEYASVLGHSFDGWYSGNDKVSNARELTFTAPLDGANATYTARWSKLSELAAFDISATDSTCTIVSVVDKTITAATLPDYVTDIGASAFSDCAELTSLILSTDLKTIGAHALRGCVALGEIDLPQGLTSVGYNAFGGCMMTRVELPQSLKSVDRRAFSDCPKLLEIYNRSTVTVTAGNGNNALNVYTPQSGASKLRTHGDFVFYVDGDDRRAIDYTGNGSVLSLPADIDGMPYKIHDYAFAYKRNVTDVQIPRAVTNLGARAFYGCKNVSELSYAAAAVDDLTSASGVFENFGSSCAVTIASGVEKIPAYLFYATATTDCDIASVTFDENCAAEIREYAFYGSRLRTVNIGEGVGKIARRAFADCEYVQVLAFDAATCADLTAQTYAFSGIGRKSDGVAVTFGKSVSKVPSYLFEQYSYGDSNVKTVDFSPDCVCSVIGQKAFAGCKSLTSVDIPKSISGIQSYAFENCVGLAHINYNAAACTDFGENNRVFYYNDNSPHTVKFDVVIGADVTAIPAYMFTPAVNKYSLISTLDVSQATKLETIGAYAFTSALKGRDGQAYIDLPDSLQTIGAHAFRGCDSIVRVTLGSNVTEIGAAAFSNCLRLAEVVNRSALPLSPGSNEYGGIASGAAAIGSQTKLVDVGDFTFYEGAGSRLLVRYFGSENDITLPDGDAYSVGSYVFYDYRITDVTLSQSVDSVLDHAFENTALKELVIPDTLSSVGAYAFSNCAELSRVRIGTGVVRLGNYAFYGSGLTSLAFDATSCEAEAVDAFVNTPDFDVAVGNGVTVLADRLFASSNVASVTFEPDYALERVGARAFFYAEKLSALALPDTVAEIGDYAFAYTALESFSVPTKVQNIGDHAFYHSALSSLTMSDGVKTLGAHAFENTALASISVPDGVHTIGEAAFAGVSAATSLSIGRGVSAIGNGAFDGCSGLTQIAFNATSCADFTENNAVFANAGNGAAVTIGADANIPAYLFYPADGGANTPSITSVTFTTGGTGAKIGAHAFRALSGLTSIDIPDGVRDIGEYAFYGCNAQTVTIGRGVQSIGAHAFYDGRANGACENIYFNAQACADFSQGDDVFATANGVTASQNTVVHIGSGVTHIPAYMLGGRMNNLKEVEFAEQSSCESIGEAAFRGSVLSGIVIPDSVTQIGAYALADCARLTSVVLPANLSEIPEGLLAVRDQNINGKDITVNMPLKITAIGDYAFYRAHIDGVAVPSKVARIGAHAFDSCIYARSVNFAGGSVCASIGEYAFYGMTQLSQITVPNSVTEIGAYAFSNCLRLSSVALPDGLTVLSEGIFSMTENQAYDFRMNVTLPASLVEIGEKAFYDNQLDSIAVPSGVNKIGKNALICGLKSVTFEDKNGWKAGSVALSATELTVANITKYKEYVWTKSV